MLALRLLGRRSVRCVVCHRRAYEQSDASSAFPIKQRMLSLAQGNMPLLLLLRGGSSSLGYNRAHLRPARITNLTRQRMLMERETRRSFCSNRETTSHEAGTASSARSQSLDWNVHRYISLVEKGKSKKAARVRQELLNTADGGRYRRQLEVWDTVVRAQHRSGKFGSNALVLDAVQDTSQSERVSRILSEGAAGENVDDDKEVISAIGTLIIEKESLCATLLKRMLLWAMEGEEHHDVIFQVARAICEGDGKGNGGYKAMCRALEEINGGDVKVPPAMLKVIGRAWVMAACFSDHHTRVLDEARERGDAEEDTGHLLPSELWPDDTEYLQYELPPERVESVVHHLVALVKSSPADDAVRDRYVSAIGGVCRESSETLLQTYIVECAESGGMLDGLLRDWVSSDRWEMVFGYLTARFSVSGGVESLNTLLRLLCDDLFQVAYFEHFKSLEQLLKDHTFFGDSETLTLRLSIMARFGFSYEYQKCEALAHFLHEPQDIIPEHIFALVDAISCHCLERDVREELKWMTDAAVQTLSFSEIVELLTELGTEGSALPPGPSGRVYVRAIRTLLRRWGEALGTIEECNAAMQELISSAELAPHVLENLYYPTLSAQQFPEAVAETHVLALSMSLRHGLDKHLEWVLQEVHRREHVLNVDTMHRIVELARGGGISQKRLYKKLRSAINAQFTSS